MKTSEKPLIFIVDDDKSFLKTIELYVKQFFQNYKVFTFLTGEECLQSLNLKPDIVLLDYILNANYPDAMNGLKILNTIKKTNPETAIIMLSGQDRVGVAVDTMKHGAFDYIVKDDHLFYNVQNAIKNVRHALDLKKDKDRYKLKMQLLLALLVALVGILVYMTIFRRYLLF
jgi:two-component system OmpR family response regulator